MVAIVDYYIFQAAVVAVTTAVITNRIKNLRIIAKRDYCYWCSEVT